MLVEWHFHSTVVSILQTSRSAGSNHSVRCLIGFSLLTSIECFNVNKLYALLNWVVWHESESTDIEDRRDKHAWACNFFPLVQYYFSNGVTLQRFYSTLLSVFINCNPVFEISRFLVIEVTTGSPLFNYLGA